MRREIRLVMDNFRKIFANARRILILTGAGVSAESGVPTFRGAGGLWRNYQAQDLATPEAFKWSPSLVWEFYHYRREVMRSKYPNRAHVAIADTERELTKQGKHVVIVTQNIDELHKRAGSKNILELHGSLFKTRCIKCKDVQENTASPICPALQGKGAPDSRASYSDISIEKLPHCMKCSGLLRPHVVWFGEVLDPEILKKANDEIESCDLCLIVGTSSMVYPAAMFAPRVAARGVPVAEFNMEPTPATHEFEFYFEGPCGTTIPEALNIKK